MRKRDIEELTLANFIYTKEGKAKIYSIVEKTEGYFINGFPIEDILFFDVSWISGIEFELYGFKKAGDQWHKDNIVLKHFSFDHWHVIKNEDGFSERFYTAKSLEFIVKKKFGIDLTISAKKTGSDKEP